MNKDVLIGWQQIRDTLYPWLNVKTVMRRRQEWMEAGVLNHAWVGRPRRKQVILYVVRFQLWTMLKERNGETI